jgi:hypothetical protein
MSSKQQVRSDKVGPLPNPTGQSPRSAVSTSRARAEASRKNGAKSRGPRTAEGKARSARNALKHGLRAEKHLLLPDEDAAAFAALEAALTDELAPEGVLQTILVRRVACATWRLERAERLEVELFAERRYGDAGAGLALIRDGNGTRSFETLLRYRGAAQAELWRALRTLKALQAETRACAAVGTEAATRSAPAPVRLAAARPASPATSPDRRDAHAADPNQPEGRANSGRAGARARPGGAPRASDPGPARPLPRPLPTPDVRALCAQPIKPETRQLGGSAPSSIPTIACPAQP